MIIIVFLIMILLLVLSLLLVLWFFEDAVARVAADLALLALDDDPELAEEAKYS